MDRLPLGAQTQYAELVQTLLHDAAEGPTLRAGSLVPKTIKGRRYWYLQYRGAGQSKQVYVGAESESLEPVLEKLRRDLEAARARTEDRGTLVSMAVAGGAYAPTAAEGRVLRMLERAGLFRVGGVLLGTHAFTVFGNMLGVRWTARDDSIALALAEDVGAADLEAARRDPATGLELWPIPTFHHKRPSTSFKVLGTELHVDLLTPMRGRESDVPVRISALGAAAQPLRFLDYVVEETLPAAVLAGDGVLVNVPDPSRFALHKLIVASRRPVTEATKAQKDLTQATQLLDVLLDDRPGDVRRAAKAIAERGRGWTAPLRSSLGKLPKELSEPVIRSLGRASV
ncbi:MAG: GSU2403 family nucleotidyltransferase fold protein [Polyangiales bacterium]